jgi:hypothetical protein
MGRFMATKRQTTASRGAAAQAEPLPADQPQASATEWMAEAAAQGVKPEQALALIGLGLVQKMAASGQDMPWVWNEAEDGGQADLAVLRQRLELTQLALQTGAPLSTAEVTQLLGARPGAAVVERGGLRARRLSRNVWKLSRLDDASSRSDDAFRRRF